MGIVSKLEAARWADYGQPTEPTLEDEMTPTPTATTLTAELATPFPEAHVQVLPPHNARYVAHAQLTQRMLQLGLRYDWEVLTVTEEPDGWWCLGRLTVHWPDRQDGKVVLHPQVITEASGMEGTPAAASSRCYARALRHIGLGLHLWAEGNGGYWLHGKLTDAT